MGAVQVLSCIPQEGNVPKAWGKLCPRPMNGVNTSAAIDRSPTSV